MKNTVHTAGGICFLLFLAGWFAGCSLDPERVSRQTDDAVYSLLEDRWEESFGDGADYRIEPFSAQTRPERVKEFEQSPVLTLARAAELAMTRTHEYQTAKEHLYLTALNLRDVQHLYEWTPFARAIGGYAKEGDQGGEGGREALGVSGEGGIRKLLASGTVLTSGLSVGYMDVLSGDFRSGLQAIFQAAVTQPLLRGADRKVVLEALTQAEQDTLYAIRDFNRFRQTFLVSVVTEYYRLLFYQMHLKYSREHYLQMLSIYDRMAPLVQAGRLAAFELEQAHQDKIRAWDSYLQARQQYETQKDVLKRMLNIPQEAPIESDVNEWAALADGLRDLPLTEEQAIEAALNQRLDLANAFDRTLDAQRHAEIAADALKADLTFVGFYSPANDGTRRYAFGAEPGDLQRVRDRYEATLRLDLPLDREREKNNYKRALIALAQQQRIHQQLTEQVVLEVRKAYRDCQEARQRYQVQKEACRLAQERLEKTLELMQVARAKSRDVLDAQKDSYQAHRAFTEAVFAYSTALLQFYRDTGMLWVKSGGGWEVRTASSAGVQP